LQPRETNINALILDTVKLLQSSLGAHIEIESRDYRPTFGPLRSIPHNWLRCSIWLSAGDAMPGGGKPTMQSANVGLDETFVGDQRELSSTGQVMVAMTDTGAGIPAAIRSRMTQWCTTT
jgi:hypothetical protein